MDLFLHYIEIILVCVFGAQVLYLFVFTLAANFKYNPGKKVTINRLKYGIIIPAYKEENIILDTVRNAIKLDYPRDQLEIVVAADHIKDETIESIRNLGVTVLEMDFEVSTKAKSVFEVLQYFGSNNTPDVVLILDADNHLDAGALKQFDQYYIPGIKVYQAHRVAKNYNLSLAVLDAVNEEIGNSIFRKGHRKLGLSSALVGSGMFLKFDYFYNLMKRLNHQTAAEDKVMELKILEDQEVIEYLPAIKVRDEKVSNSKNFQTQRTRWFGAQYLLLFDSVSTLPGALLKGNISLVDKMIQWLLFPKILLFAILGLLGGLSFFTPLNFAWLFIFAVLTFSFLLAIPIHMYNAKLLRAIMAVPGAVISVIISLIRIRKGQQKRFETTQKDYKED